MPKPSLAPKDAVESSLGFGEGNVEIVNAMFVYHKLSKNKTTGQEYDPTCALKVALKRLNKEWEPTDDDPIEEFIGVGGLNKFHPGNADSAADQDPSDLGDEPGTEGNSLYCEPGAKIDKKAKIFHFTREMEKCGFRADILANCYAPDLVGTRGHMMTLVLPKNENSTSQRDPTVVVFDKIVSKPYEKGAKGKGAAKETASSSKDAGSKKKKDADDEGDGDNQTQTEALRVLKSMNKSLAGQTVAQAKIRAKLVVTLSKLDVDTDLHKPITALFKDADWLKENGGEFDWKFDGDDVTIPEAA